MQCTLFISSSEDALLQCKTLKTPANNPNSPCPVTSYKQYKSLIQQQTNNQCSTTLTNEDIHLQKQLRKELKRLKTVKHLYSQISSTHESKRKRHRRTRARKKPTHHKTSPSSSSTSDEGDSSSSESSN
ncbi:hypothetical protein TTMV2_gp3 [Torque teno mini virus 2]|uniref:DUF755 domain-containing protein n=1 Tax=Torque teno mini virus 2 TaxID=687370 RepID=Q9JG52_9VIRU|nr:hypothetical protein TTMV2_gp3 [Torque teno mini virus 2]BAA93607.1 unnamed protein product [Torque teno mini virus 2]